MSAAGAAATARMLQGRAGGPNEDLPTYLNSSGGVQQLSGVGGGQLRQACSSSSSGGHCFVGGSQAGASSAGAAAVAAGIR